MTKKYTDWSSWWEGLRTNLFKCIGTTGTAFLGSNGLANVGIEAFKGMGITWEQAGGFFLVHIAWEIFAYMRETQPKVITVTEETEHVTRSKAGTLVETGSSKTVTVTPVADPPPKS